MSEFAATILGLDVGARQIGVAVLRGEELIFYRVKSIRKSSEGETLERLEGILTALVEKYHIQAVALKKVVSLQQLLSFVKIVYEEIKNFTLRKNIRLFEYTPAVIRQIACRGKQPTKPNTALLLSQKYTELARYFNVPKLWQKRYFAQLFNAIAVGLVCVRELEVRPNCFR